MKKVLWFCIILGSLLFTACDIGIYNAKPIKPILEYHLINGYLHIDQRATVSPSIDMEGLSIDIKMKGYYVDEDSQDECRAKYGDYIPNGWYPNGYQYYACVESIQKVKITSSKDWDSDHPAGTDLGDLFYVTYITYVPFFEDYRIEPVTKRVSELTMYDMWFVDINFSFTSAQVPEDIAEHSLTVGFSLDNQRTAVFRNILFTDADYEYAVEHGQRVTEE